MRRMYLHFSTEYFQRIKRMVTTSTAILLLLVLMVAISFDAAYCASKTVLQESNLHSQGAVAFSGSTSEVVYGLHDDRKLPPGDLVKLMTAMVVIDNMRNDNEYDNVVTISSRIDKLGSMYSKSDEVKIRELLNAMLRRNSDEAALALALYSATREEIFVSEMNSKASELGLLNTQYINPTGAADNNQYSSAYDSAVIMQYAMRYPFIEEALSANSDKANASGFEGCLLGTSRGGTQAVMATRRDGMQIIAAAMSGTPDGAVADLKKLTEYGHENAAKDVIIKAGKKVGSIMLRCGSKVRVNGYTRTKGYAYVPPEGSTTLVQTKVVMYEKLEAPLKKGEKIGEYRIYVADELKGTVDIVTDEAVETGWLPSHIYISNAMVVMLVGAAILLLLVFIRGRLRIRKKKRLMAQKRRERIRELALEQKEIEEDRARRNWTYH